MLMMSRMHIESHFFMINAIDYYRIKPYSASRRAVYPLNLNTCINSYFELVSYRTFLMINMAVVLRTEENFGCAILQQIYQRPIMLHTGKDSNDVLKMFEQVCFSSLLRNSVVVA